MDSWPQSGKGSVKNTCTLTKRDMFKKLNMQPLCHAHDCDIVKGKKVPLTTAFIVYESKEMVG